MTASLPAAIRLMSLAELRMLSAISERDVTIGRLIEARAKELRKEAKR